VGVFGDNSGSGGVSVGCCGDGFGDDSDACKNGLCFLLMVLVLITKA
jgi:hypothetical protein